MSRFEPDPGSLASLRRLLLVTIPGVPAAPRFVFTTAPHLWLADPADDLILIDVSDLLGRFSQWSELAGGHRSSLELEVRRSLLAAGWPESAIRVEVRPDPKSRLIADFALFDDAGHVIAILDIKDNRYARNDQAAERLRQFAALPTVRWACGTDGRFFQFIARDGSSHIVAAPPSPQDLGIQFSAPASAGSGEPLVLRPASAESFRAILAEHVPAGAIVDFTLPWGIRLPEASPFRSLLSEVATGQSRGSLEPGQALLAAVAANGSVRQASVVMPPAFSWAESARWLRDLIGTSLGLAAHIELPQGVWSPMTSVGGSYFLFGGRPGKTYYDSLASPSELIRPEASSWFASLSGWLAGRPPDRGFETGEASPENWSLAANDPQAQRTRERMSRLGDARPLSELADVFVGGAVPREATLEEPAPGSIRIIDARQLRPDQDGASARHLRPGYSVRDRDLLQVGDVLLPRVYTATSRAIVYDEGTPAVAGNSVIVVRRQPDGPAPAYVAEFLNSATGRRLLQAASRGTVVPQTSVAALRNLPVPVLDLDTNELTEVGTLAAALNRAAEELAARRLELFDSSDPAEFRSRLAELRTRAGRLAEAIRLSDSLDFQIRNIFPFPLAYAYRLPGAIVEPQQKYKEQLRVAENILAFLGSLSLAILSEGDRAGLGDYVSEMTRGGVSPGHWRELITRCSRLLREYHGNPLAAAICRLNVGAEQRGFGKDIHFLIQRKNDFKHDRGPASEADLLSGSESLQAALQHCMEALAFLTRHPIRQVQRSDAVRRQPGRQRVTCLRVAGDHPGFQQETLDWHEPLPRGDLYVELGDREWRPLFPFVQSVTCPKCKVEEICFIDRWDQGRRTVTLKSFERGHTDESKAADPELRASLRLP